MKIRALFFGLIGLALSMSPRLLRAEPVLSSYDCWGNLGFEDGPPANVSQWSAGGTSVTYIDDASQAHSGHGAAKIDGTSAIFIWGAGSAGDSPPVNGDTVGADASQAFTSAELADATGSGPTASSRDDGVSNLLKYAFGIDLAATMTAPVMTALPRVGVSVEEDDDYLR